MHLTEIKAPFDLQHLDPEERIEDQALRLLGMMQEETTSTSSARDINAIKSHLLVFWFATFVN